LSVAAPQVWGGRRQRRSQLLESEWAILDVDEAAAGETARETGGFAITADVTDAGSVEAAVTAARERHGPACTAVNCAGIGTAGRIIGRYGPMPLDAFRRVIEVNLILQCLKGRHRRTDLAGRPRVRALWHTRGGDRSATR